MKKESGLWIPLEVLKINNLNSSEKMILAAIVNFSNGKDGKCTAYNSTLAKNLNLSLSTVNHVIPALKSKGYITVQGRGCDRTITLQTLQEDTANLAGTYCKPCNKILQTLQEDTANLADSLIYEIKEKEKGNKGEEKEASPLLPPETDFSEVNNEHNGDDKRAGKNDSFLSWLLEEDDDD